MPLLPYRLIVQALSDHNIQRLQQGRTTCLTILGAEPENLKCLDLMGKIEYQMDKPEAAATWFEKALRIAPPDAELYYNYAQSLIQQGKFPAAAVALKNALRIKADYTEAYHRLGDVYLAIHDTSHAVSTYQKALALCGDDPDIQNSLGRLWLQTGALADAEHCFVRILEAVPDHMPAWNNLGMVHFYQGEFEHSAACFRQVLELNPSDKGALNNLGSVLKASGDYPAAIDAFERALALDGQFAQAHNNLAMARLGAGQFAAGWQSFEWRWRKTSYAELWQSGQKPLWRGEQVDGGVLLIRAEQGYGDMLQFCRYAPLASRRGLRVILEAHPPLVRLLQALPGVERVIATGDALPEHDFFCPLMSLPLAFGTRLETIPAEIPYLFADKGASRWQERLPDGEKRLRVGLVWAGNPRQQFTELFATDRRRSLDPRLLAPLLEVEGVRFFSLQKFGTAAPPEFGLIDWMQECEDFADTAALIARLDLVISVDTSVVHLAGALGKPVWLLNRFDSCWRWLQEREDSPWYPNLRLFRQQHAGDWTEVVLRVRDELKELSRGF